MRNDQRRPRALKNDLFHRLLREAVVDGFGSGLRQHDEIAAMGVAHEGRGLVGFVDHCLERLDAGHMAFVAKALRRPFGLIAQRLHASTE